MQKSASKNIIPSESYDFLNIRVAIIYNYYTACTFLVCMPKIQDGRHFWQFFAPKMPLACIVSK